jgi:hypothetical protein
MSEPALVYYSAEEVCRTPRGLLPGYDFGPIRGPIFHSPVINVSFLCPTYRDEGESMGKIGTEPVEVSSQMPRLELEQGGNGLSIVFIKDWHSLQKPGFPIVPSQVHSVAIPPATEVSGLQLTDCTWERLPGCMMP